jgi:ACR3 family arsenite efflux pump ArsB
MADLVTAPTSRVGEKRLAFFERYLSIWVGLCMMAGLLVGKVLPRGVQVGVLVEVPVMLSVCAACNRTRHWFPSQAT